VQGEFLRLVGFKLDDHDLAHGVLSWAASIPPRRGLKMDRDQSGRTGCIG